jgi:hypothetical protein
MAEHGEFSLEFPERLEFPTETWAAQELRRGNVLLAAATVCDAPAQRDTLRRRGEEILTGAWQRLFQFSTRDYTRPLALALQQGYVELGLRNAAPSDFPNDEPSPQWPPATRFVSQREHVRAMFRSPPKLLSGIRRLCDARRWAELTRRSWAAESARRVLAKVH